MKQDRLRVPHGSQKFGYFDLAKPNTGEFILSLYKLKTVRALDRRDEVRGVF